MSSITNQKYALRFELGILVQDFIELATPKTHMYFTLGLADSVTSKLTLKELTGWRDRLKGEVAKLMESET